MRCDTFDTYCLYFVVHLVFFLGYRTVCTSGCLLKVRLVCICEIHSIRNSFFHLLWTSGVVYFWVVCWRFRWYAFMKWIIYGALFSSVGNLKHCHLLYAYCEVPCSLHVHASDCPIWLRFCAKWSAYLRQGIWLSFARMWPYRSSGHMAIDTAKEGDLCLEMTS